MKKTDKAKNRQYKNGLKKPHTEIAELNVCESRQKGNKIEIDNRVNRLQKIAELSMQLT